MENQIMLDIETWGTDPGSVITSIGAVRFNTEEVLDDFYEIVDPASCVEVGLKIDPNTIKWWMGQSDKARGEFQKEGKHIGQVLAEFAGWIHLEGYPPGIDVAPIVWGNGAIFDNVLMTSAYQATGIKRPWSYKGDYCYRTIKNLFPDIKFERVGELHNALDDARSQALHLIEILKFACHSPLMV